MSQSILGVLYIVASPIGNLQDITYRAVHTLSNCDLILVEDTRRARILCQHYAITTPVKMCNEHNESRLVAAIIALLIQGQQIAVLSDAGTPLISDPGYRLVVAAIKAGIKVVPLPGPCAAIAALSASGLSPAKFIFEGFLPAKAGARCKVLTALRQEKRTLIFYEAPHRIIKTLQDMQVIFGADRQVVLARELSKLHETIYSGELSAVVAWLNTNPQQQLGEMVLLVAGSNESPPGIMAWSAHDLLQVLLLELPVKQAVQLTNKLTGLSKNNIYALALKLQQLSTGNVTATR
jgi:16S rRNA (cytidine1402-2'-O)-methyltransferase